jgi:hypothetical protein
LSPDDYREIVAVFNGKHPETGEDLIVFDEAREGFPPVDLPAQTDVFAPDYAPEEIKAIAQSCARRPACRTSRSASSPTLAATAARARRSPDSEAPRGPSRAWPRDVSRGAREVASYDGRGNGVMDGR